MRAADPDLLPRDFDCDVLVVGAGAGGLATAITARKKGLRVVVAEKAEVFGGTAAFSGGVLWIPGNPVSRRAGAKDSREQAERLLRGEAGDFFDAEATAAFLEYGTEMVDFFECETAVKFVPTLYPDYHPDRDGGAELGRSILAAPFDIRELGKDMARLRPPLETITFMGMMFNSSNADLKHFFRATKSLTSFLYVVRRLANHLKEVLLYRRGINVTSGNALAARLAKSALDLNIPILTGTPAQDLTREGGRISGAVLRDAQGERRAKARVGVVLAAGGFAQSEEFTRRAYPHLQRGARHVSPVPPENTGDGARLAERAGARLEFRYPNAAAWMPVSVVPLGNGRSGVFPHLLDRYKPGIIGVNALGQRFTNESNSYHDVGEAMIKDCQGRRETAMWLICDQTAMSRYGLGYAKPAPMPLGSLIRSGYLLKAPTLMELARQAGIDAAGLEATVRQYNKGAMKGEDRQFGRGTTAFNRYLADPDNQPNPCVAPLARAPYYAVKLLMGDLGSFDGLPCTVEGQVLDVQAQPIEGLYAVGNDRASIMGGSYPGAGITLGPIMTFGYLTGKHLARIGAPCSPDS